MPPCVTQVEVLFTGSIVLTEGDARELEDTLVSMREGTLTPIREVVLRERSVVVNTGRFNYTLEEIDAIADEVESWAAGFIFGPSREEVVVRCVESDLTETADTTESRPQRERRRNGRLDGG